MAIWRYYSTLARAKNELKANTTSDDSILLNLIKEASVRIDGIMNPARARPFFAPYAELRKMPLQRRRVNSYQNTYSLRAEHLLAFSAVLLTDGSGNNTDITGEVELYNTYAPNTDYLRITNNSRSWYDRVTQCRPPYNVWITGTWGYNTDYENAWETITTLGADIATAAATSMTVVSATNISPAAMLRIDGEFIGVAAVSGTTITIQRGVNGSTAATHLSGANVELYHVDDRIARVTARQAALMYTRRGAYEVETIDGIGVITYPQDLLTELRNVLTDVMHGS